MGTCGHEAAWGREVHHGGNCGRISVHSLIIFVHSRESPPDKYSPAVATVVICPIFVHLRECSCAGEALARQQAFVPCTPLARPNGKLVDNFSPESDVTSLQDPFTSHPYKTPYFTIVFPVKSEEASS